MQCLQQSPILIAQQKRVIVRESNTYGHNCRLIEADSSILAMCKASCVEFPSQIFHSKHSKTLVRYNDW